MIPHVCCRLFKGECIRMKICRFLSVMMVFALVISSVSALADYTVSTTTTYNTASGKVDVQTTVTGLTDGSMTS